MTDPIPTNAPNLRRRTLLYLSLFALIAIPVAVYLNKVSTHWVPDAETKVRAVQKQQAERTFAAIREEAARHPDAAAAQESYAQALADRGSFIEALMPAERAVKAAPRDAGAHLLLADILSPLDYRQEALRSYREAIRLDPGALPAYQHLGDLLLAVGQPAEAEKVYLQARKRDPDSPGPPLSLAQLYLQESRSDQVLATLSPLLKSHDPPVAALYMAGKANVTIGQSLRGIDLLRRAIQKQPDFADAHHALGSALANQGKYADGISELQRAVDLAPGNSSYLYALGNALLSDMSRADRLEQAQRQFEASLERDPQSEWAHYYYGITLEQKGEVDAATREYRRVLEINPEFASCYYRLGTLYRSEGRTAEAKKLLDYFDRKSKNAITLVHGQRRDNSAVDSAEYRYQRGVAALKAGKRDLARSEFQAALARDPNYVPAQRDLRSLQAGRP